MVMFPFHTVTSKWNTFCAIQRSIPVTHTQVINKTLGMSYRRGKNQS